MPIRSSLYLFLMITAFISMNVCAGEFSKNKFDGLQLAWTLIPSTSNEEKPSSPPQKKDVKPKLKPKSKPKYQAKPKTIQQYKASPALPPATKPEPHISPIQAKPAIVHSVKPITTEVIHYPPKKDKRSFDFVIGIGLDWGGEVLGTVTYTDGSSAPVNANSGIMINAGAVIENGEDSDFSTQVTIGYKSGGPKLWSSEVNWSAVSLEGIEFYRWSTLRMGLGMTYVLNPQLKVNIPASSFTDQYNNTFGFIGQIGWIPYREHYSLDLRYTSIKFQLNNGPMVDGSVIGIDAYYYF